MSAWLHHPGTITAIVIGAPLAVAGLGLFLRELRIERAHRILNAGDEDGAS